MSELAALIPTYVLPWAPAIAGATIEGVGKQG
ncbi:hypothetical protein OJHNALOF_02986 [Oceanimonas sp. MB9]|nr:hypothetical protein [Oceanimonas sp. MB9]